MDVNADDVTEVVRTGKVQGDGEEARANSKGKGKAHDDTMEVDEVIVIDKAKGETEEWDGLV